MAASGAEAPAPPGRGEDEVGLHMFSFLFQIQQSFLYHEGVISEGVERPRMLYSWCSLRIKGNTRSGEEQVHIEEGMSRASCLTSEHLPTPVALYQPQHY